MENYYSLSSYLKKNFGEKLYKLSLDGGMTCPNRDGSLDSRGCIFCSAGGSGDFTPDRTLPMDLQIAKAKERISSKYQGNSYIAYFQAYTNTYAPIDYLEKLYNSVIQLPEIKVLSIATRPDCLSDDVLSLLSRLNKIKPVWVELGLQTIHEDTAAFIRRGYPTEVFYRAVENLRKENITVITHVILGLPGEDKARMLETIHALNQADIQGVKLQLLHILKGTDLADHYEKQPFFIPDMEEYFALLGSCINHLSPDIAIHRLTGDGPKDLLIAPLWTRNKRYVLNQMQKYFKENDIRQGKDLNHEKTVKDL